MSRPALELFQETADPDAAAAELLRRIARQDREAFRTFYQLYAQRLGNFLMKLLKRPEWVDEAVNDVMLAIWQQAGDFDPAKGRFSTWLFGIAHNKGLKILERARRHQAEQPLETEPAGDAEDDPAERAGHEEQRDPSNPERTVLGWELGEILAWALERLSVEHRAVLELTFSEGRTYQEIAEITDCPVNTVKTRVFHARRKLFELLEQRGYSPAVPTQEG